MGESLGMMIARPFVRAVLSGILLGLSFPPSPVSSLAFIAFLPFLSVFESEQVAGRFIRLTYAFLLAFHAVTVYWTGGFTHGHDQWMMIAGAALLLIHPFFMLPFITGAWWVRRKLGRLPGLAAFVSFWLVFEFFHARGELSFPWMAVGNSQAYDLFRIQMAELVSVQGLGLTILVFNVVAFLVMKMAADGEWADQRRKGRALLAVMAALYVLPLLYGWVRVTQVEEEPMQHPLRVGVVQPNVDPWEKWGTPTSRADIAAQIGTLDSMTRSLPEGLDLIVWPETAVPGYLLLPQYGRSLDSVRSVALSSGSNILTGFPHARYYSRDDAPVTAKKTTIGDRYYESFNSAVLIHKDGTIGQFYAKVVLVPFAERLPHAGLLAFLIEPLRWNVGISSWGKGTDTTLFRIAAGPADSVSFGAMICYESVYPDYVREFVRKGATFLVVLTNNSWWGRTSGPYQHAAYASLRAVENRRWVVQSANGGVSTIVHPSGRPMVSTPLFEPAAIANIIDVRTDTTFYGEHGDIVGTVNVVVAAGMMVWCIIRSRLKNISRNDRNGKKRKLAT